MVRHGQRRRTGAETVEFEARFVGVDLDHARERLAGFPNITLDFPRTLLRRYILDDASSGRTGGYLRLRTGEFGRSFLTLKRARGSAGVDTFAEISIEVGDEAACLALFERLGFPVLRYQENYREQWRRGSTVFDLDEWPGLPPFLEIEAENAEGVAAGAALLGLSMAAAEFDNVSDTYRKRVGRDILSEPRLVFP